MFRLGIIFPYSLRKPTQLAGTLVSVKVCLLNGRSLADPRYMQRAGNQRSTGVVVKTSPTRIRVSGFYGGGWGTSCTTGDIGCYPLPESRDRVL